MRQESIFAKAYDLAVTSLTVALMLPAVMVPGAPKTTTTTKTTEL